jgi:hypothetical protein
VTHWPSARRGHWPGFSWARPGGRPHAAGIGAVWPDGDLYFTSGPGTRKSRDLAANPACTISVKLPGLDLTLQGRAIRVTEPAPLTRVAAIYRDIGWLAEVAGDACTAPFSAPSTGRRPGRCTGSPARSSAQHRRAERRDPLAVQLMPQPSMFARSVRRMLGDMLAAHGLRG